MEYRRLPHGSEEISVLGFGTSSIGMAGEKEAEAAMTLALENGVKVFGVTKNDVDATLDGGKIITQRAVGNDGDDIAEL